MSKPLRVACILEQATYKAGDQAPEGDAGFYYWQNNELHSISPMAVHVVQVSKYKNRDGFNCQTLTRDSSEPTFDCDLGNEPPGRWAGPLPKPWE